MPPEKRDPAGTAAWLDFVQKAFIVHDGQLLMVCKADSDPHTPGLWEVPGGRMLPGEDLDVHIRREVWEETGVHIEPGRPFHLWQWSMPSSRSPHGPDVPIQVIAVGRSCRPTSLEVSIDHRVAGDHLGEVRWVPLTDVERYDIIPSLKPALEDFIRGHERPVR